MYNTVLSTAVVKWGMHTTERIGHSQRDPNLLPFPNHLFFPLSMSSAANICISLCLPMSLSLFQLLFPSYSIQIWDKQSLECLKILTGHTGSVLCLQYDERVIVTGSSDSTVRYAMHLGYKEVYCVWRRTQSRASKLEKLRKIELRKSLKRMLLITVNCSP